MPIMTKACDLGKLPQHSNTESPGKTGSLSVKRTKPADHSSCKALSDKLQKIAKTRSIAQFVNI